MVYSANISFLIFLIIMQGVLQFSVAKEKVKEIPSVKIHCREDKNCINILGPGGECDNEICVCKNETLCSHKPKLTYKVNTLGEQCGSDEDCNINDANCVDGYCVCSHNQVSSENHRVCLTVSDGLGEYCQEDVQCISAITNSICRENKCICNNMTHEDKNQCWKNMGLGGLCMQEEDCSNIPLSRCGKMFCECQTGYVASEKRDECLPEVLKPGDICEENAQCAYLYGNGGICRFNSCECDPVHRLANDKICPSNLKKYCDKDDDCKIYNEDLSIHCDQNRCECLPPYFEENGHCSGAGPVNKISTVLLSLLSFVILCKFV